MFYIRAVALQLMLSPLVSICSIQVMEPDVPGPVCLVVDCPDASFIDSLVTGEVWSEYQERQMGGVGGGVGAGEGNGVGAGVGEGEGLKGGPGSKAGKVLCVVHLAPEVREWGRIRCATCTIGIPTTTCGH